jgi:hypothetical protein
MNLEDMKQLSLFTTYIVVLFIVCAGGIIRIPKQYPYLCVALISAYLIGIILLCGRYEPTTVAKTINQPTDASGGIITDASGGIIADASGASTDSAYDTIATRVNISMFALIILLVILYYVNLTYSKYNLPFFAQPMFYILFLSALCTSVYNFLRMCLKGYSLPMFVNILSVFVLSFIAASVHLFQNVEASVWAQRGFMLLFLTGLAITLWVVGVDQLVKGNVVLNWFVFIAGVAVMAVVSYKIFKGSITDYFSTANNYLQTIDLFICSAKDAFVNLKAQLTNLQSLTLLLYKYKFVIMAITAASLIWGYWEQIASFFKYIWAAFIDFFNFDFIKRSKILDFSKLFKFNTTLPKIMQTLGPLLLIGLLVGGFLLWGWVVVVVLVVLFIVGYALSYIPAVKTFGSSMFNAVKNSVYLPLNVSFPQKQYLNKETSLSVGKFKYRYALSFWVYLVPQPPNESAQANQFVNIISYGRKPAVVYNAANNVLRVSMLSQAGENIFIADVRDMKLQTWSNVVLNVDASVIDIFIDGKLYASVPSVPADGDTILSVGENKGNSGFIAGVLFLNNDGSSETITADQVRVLYENNVGSDPKF